VSELEGDSTNLQTDVSLKTRVNDTSGIQCHLHSIPF
jgi:hypothetical protein